MKRQLPIFHQISVFINGRSGLLALILIIFGGIIFPSTIEDIDIDELIYLYHNTEIGEGKIIRVYETNKSSEEGNVFGYEYNFFSTTGNLKSISYSTEGKFSIGDNVDIEYSINRPEINRISGFSRTPGGVLSILSLLPIITGSIWLIFNVIKGLKKTKY